MRNDSMPSRESGVVIIGLFVLIIIGVVVGVFLFVKQEHDNKSVSTTAAEAVEAGGSALSRNAQNVQRKQDAARLLNAAAEYITNNSGNLPTEMSDNMLLGMGYYARASIAQGEQDPVTTDELRLVTGARCLATGATADGSSRQYAAQFSLKKDDGSFDPQCKDS